MPRVKSSVATRQRRKRVLKLSKGYFGSKHLLYRTAHEQVMRSLRYAYRDRRQIKREMRKLWITRINAGARLNDATYSELMHGLRLAEINVNRKMLAEMAIHDPEAFSEIVKLAKNATKNGKSIAVARTEVVKETVAASKAAAAQAETTEVKAPVKKAPATKEKVEKPAVTKKATATKAAEKKPATKKATATKATAEKKPAAKKATATKTTEKKPATKKATTTKTTAEKKPAAKKTTATKATAEKKPAAKKAAE